ncbi:hypothetical protein [Leptothoe sp. PORK10 BA2]|uniref:hypothetical protein n=1 Tax=Leptothoe sp. PORK10 BA2 TaxID=3110254 RepID=UPI002B203C6D|nr:hypothetical protein [Leptothoe sp. PORK10 BA2]MEA5463919.1 hypothetical protein [Leptothoe sp. PORK10 BA2]
MPVVFDQVVGTVAPPPSAGGPSEAATPAPPPAEIKQMFAQMLRDRAKRTARLRAD